MDDGSVSSEFDSFRRFNHYLNITMIWRIIRSMYTKSRSVWHPLQGPLIDWPLAVCSATSVDYVADTMAGDVIDRDAAFENTQVHFNSNQKWYYLPDQMPSEVLVFKNADSEEQRGGNPGMHFAISSPLVLVNYEIQSLRLSRCASCLL